MKITQKDVAYVANLANLDLTDAERLRMEKDLNRILEYVDQLAEVNTDNVLPMSQVSQIRTGQTGIFDPWPFPTIPGVRRNRVRGRSNRE